VLIVCVLLLFIFGMSLGQRELREVNRIELFPEEAFPFGAEEGEIVQAGMRGRMRDRIRLDVRQGRGEDAVGFGELEKGVVEPDLDAGEVERIVAQLDGLAAEVGRDAIAVGAEGEGSGLGDLTLVAVEKGLAQFLGVSRAGGRSGILTRAFEGGLTGFGVELAMVDNLDPGQERFIELGKSGDGGEGKFGKKVGLDELEEALDLAAALGVVGSAEDALDAQGSADGVQVLGGVDFGLVDVDGQGAAVAEDGALEAVLQAGELLVPVELGVGDEAGVIIEEGEEKNLALVLGIGRIGKVGAVHGIALPQVTEVLAFETAVGLGARRASGIGLVWSRERMRMMERAERRGCSRFRASARSRVWEEIARHWPWSRRGWGLSPSKPRSR
jgi:hypothetical protein